VADISGSSTRWTRILMAGPPVTDAVPTSGGSGRMVASPSVIRCAKRAAVRLPTAGAVATTTTPSDGP
jgi:hypothetical protein